MRKSWFSYFVFGLRRKYIVKKEKGKKERVEEVCSALLSISLNILSPQISPLCPHCPPFLLLPLPLPSIHSTTVWFYFCSYIHKHTFFQESTQSLLLIGISQRNGFGPVDIKGERRPALVWRRASASLRIRIYFFFPFSFLWFPSFFSNFPR